MKLTIGNHYTFGGNQPDYAIVLAPTPADIYPATLGEAIQLRRDRAGQTWACACIGGVNCCRLVDERAEQLYRAAHIVVKQLAGLMTMLDA